MTRESFATGGMPWIGDLPMSAAVRVGDLVFLGGHAAIAADGSVDHPGDVAAQARQAFEGHDRGVLDAGLERVFELAPRSTERS